MFRSLVSTQDVFDKAHLYRRAVFMGLCAVFASAAIIAYYDRSTPQVSSTGALAVIELAFMTLMPYLISAVIATLTAIGVMSILPNAKVAAPAKQIVTRLREISDGDLTVRVRLNADDPLKEVGTAFNAAATGLSDRVAHWKVVNRQQWGVLCRIRQSIEEGDREKALRFVSEMEQNWDRIAEIEQQLIC
jgi:methyl-accepting chemotaxis protein